MVKWVDGLRRMLSPKPAPRVAVRRFEAARIDRLTGDWFATQSSINEELRSDLDRLRHRGRQLVNNNDYARKFRGMVADNIVGPSGIRLQVRVEDKPGQPDRLANAAIEAAWAEWCSSCDVTGRLSLRDLCETIVGSLPSDGEFLVRIIKGDAAGNRFGIALQVIDVDRIDTSHAAVLPGGNRIVMGVELNEAGRPVAIHVFASHPNDGHTSNRQRVRIAAGEMLHRFKVERADQARGVPWMAPGMLSLHHLGGFMLSALLAAEHGANHYGFFQTPDGGPPGIAQDDGSGQAITTSQPGTYDTLPQGVTFQAHESKYPNEVFAPFAKTCLQRIATGWRVAYHSLANDLEGVSFSSIRSGTLEERDRWAADQQWFIDAFMEPVYLAWLQWSLMQGAITMPNGSALPSSKLQKFAAHEWQPRRWEWVDPKSDMEAKVLAVRAGLMAPQDLAAAMGYDFEDTLKAIRDAQAMAKEFGVQLNAYAGTPGATPAASPAAPAEPAAGRGVEVFAALHRGEAEGRAAAEKREREAIAAAAASAARAAKAEATLDAQAVQADITNKLHAETRAKDVAEAVRQAALREVAAVAADRDVAQARATSAEADLDSLIRRMGESPPAVQHKPPPPAQVADTPPASKPVTINPTAP